MRVNAIDRRHPRRSRTRDRRGTNSDGHSDDLDPSYGRADCGADGYPNYNADGDRRADRTADPDSSPGGARSDRATCGTDPQPVRRPG